MSLASVVDCLILEVEGVVYLRNVRNHLPDNKTLHPNSQLLNNTAMRNSNLARQNCCHHILTHHNKGMISKGTVSVHAKKAYGESEVQFLSFLTMVLSA
jgi:hypothetical protein